METQTGQKIRSSVFTNRQAVGSRKAAASSTPQRGVITKPSIEQINKFDNSKRYLDALLHAIYCIGVAEQLIRIDGNTLSTLVSMAEEHAGELGTIFEEVTDGPGVTQ